jgi:hypothetical protein
MKVEIFLLVGIIIFDRTACQLNCNQAWNVDGTGSWYRVDTSCEYSFDLLLLTIIIPWNLTLYNDEFYIIFGIFNGVSIDIGLTYNYIKKIVFIWK